MYGALAWFGAPLGDYTPRDLITSMPAGLTFADAWERRKAGQLYGKEVPFISIEDLITVKRAAGRAQDLLDR